jgi:prepilin-type N-terminal cleavage/methylation domain-containing protein
MTSPRTGTVRHHGFTLIEVLLATAIFSIVLVAINVVFFAALHLRQRTTAAVEQSLPLNRALAILRKDIQNTVPPGGTLSGQFRYGVTGSSVTGSSGTGVNSGLNSSAMGNTALSQNGSLDFYTSTGVINDYQPWSDIQEVSYQLVEAADRDKALGKDLVRTANRNLLSYTSPTPETTRLVGNVEKLEFFFYDGTQWRDVWDTTSGDASLPLAVRARLYLASDRQAGNQRLEPVEMVVQIQACSNSSTNSTQTAQTGS